MSVNEVTIEDFDEMTSHNGVVLIDCWAPWCGACKGFKPVFEAAAARHPEHSFVTINTQAERELTDKLKVSHIPTLILFRDGILLLREPGYVPAEGLDEIVSQAESLDMDHVRSEMAKEEKSTA